MSCESTANRFSKIAGQISGGISALAGKRSFYAGVAVGAGGAAGVMGLVKALGRRKNEVRTVTRRGTGRAPKLEGSRTRPRQIPKAALEAKKGSRANPRPIPRQALAAKPGSRTNPRPIPTPDRDGPGKRQAKPIPRKPTAEVTKLQASPVPVQLGQGQSFTPTRSYRVLRSDGSDTGLALTPYLRSGQDGQWVEDEKGWGVTHARSGSLISGPHDSVSGAQDLAGRLSSLRWTADRVPAQDVAQARQIIKAYRSERSETQLENGRAIEDRGGVKKREL